MVRLWQIRPVIEDILVTTEIIPDAKIVWQFGPLATSPIGSGGLRF
jgi:hypothetical protein